MEKQFAQEDHMYWFIVSNYQSPTGHLLKKEITEMVVLMGVGSTEISSIQELRAVEPESEVADLLQQRVTNCSFWVTAAEHWRQQLLSLAASLVFAKVITAAEISSHQRIWAVFAYPCGPLVLSLLTARIFTQVCLHLDSREADALQAKIPAHRKSNPGKTLQIRYSKIRKLHITQLMSRVFCPKLSIQAAFTE